MTRPASHSVEVQAAAAAVTRRWPHPARCGIVLGSGLGNFADHIEQEAVIPYADLPGFPLATALGHQGQLVCGHCESQPVFVMQGRNHFYEGLGIRAVAFPIRVLRQLGIDTLILSNASGGLNPQYDSGDIMVIDDHLNLMFRNPLIGPHRDEWGPRFPDMSAPYDRALIEGALRLARQTDVRAHLGVYAAVTGPSYETRAEYRMLRRMGADAVGMSTVPEVLVAVQAGLRVLGLSAITNLCRPDVLDHTSGEAVIQAAQNAEPKMTTIVRGLLREMSAATA